MEEKLAWLDQEYLSDYDERNVDSKIHLQKPFDTMRDITTEYAVAANEPTENNAFLSYNKVVGTTLDEKLYLAFQVLDYALLSAPGAPITMSLLEAGIAQDVAGSYNTSFYQPVFSVIARGADEKRKDEFVGIIEEILQAIVEQGMDPQSLLAGINYYEFRFREADFGGYPKGLIYGMQMMESWLYDETKPFIHLEALDTFEYLKAQVETGYFEKLIQTYLLDNEHGSVVAIVPEQGRTARLDERLRVKLADYKASLSKEEVERLVENTYRLAAYQETPSSQEDLEKLPLLTREDISKEITPICNEELNLAGVPMVFHEVETNGIGYLTLMFDMSDVPEELLPYAGVLNAVLGMVNTKHYDYGTLFNEINVNTGGIEPSLEAYADVTRAKEKAYRAMFEVHGKALYDKVPFLICMMQEMLTASKFDDENRLGEILAMTMSRLQMEIMSAGHSVAVLRAMSYSSPIAKCKDLMGGIDFFDNVCRLAMCFDEEKADLMEKLQELAKLLFRKGNMLISYTASREGLEGLEAAVCELNESLYPEREVQEHGVVACEKKNEGFKSSSQVQFVAQTGNFVDAGVEYTGALQILKTIMSFDYLWFNIRMRGGAYGCMSSFNRVGEGYFVSYRDPNLADTLAVYEGIPEYLANFTVSERDMTKFIIGTISGIDQPLTPSAKGDRSMNLYMTHVTAEMLQKERNEILTAEEADIRALAKAAEAILADKNICVIGNEAVVEEDRDIFMTVEELF